MDVKGILTLLCLMPVINGINRGTLVGDNLPFIGQLRYKYTNKLFVYECGVSPIGRKNVLTTKGCIHEKPKIDVSQYRVVLGSNQMESGGKTYTVTKIQLHPTVDLALLTVRSQIPENSTLKIDCSSEILVNQSATVYGFGSTSAGYGTHQKLSTQTRKVSKELFLLQFQNPQMRHGPDFFRPTSTCIFLHLILFSYACPMCPGHLGFLRECLKCHKF